MMYAAHAAGKPTGFLPTSSNGPLPDGKESEKSKQNNARQRFPGSDSTAGNAFILFHALPAACSKIEQVDCK
jgi:hypothetical protein